MKNKIFVFPNEAYKKPIAIVGYNNAGKTNLMNSIKYGLYESVREDTFELKDFYDCKLENSPIFKLNFFADIGDDKILPDRPYNNTSELKIVNHKISEAVDVCDCYTNPSYRYSKKWVIKQKHQFFILISIILKKRYLLKEQVGVI